MLQRKQKRVVKDVNYGIIAQRFKAVTFVCYVVMTKLLYLKDEDKNDIFPLVLLQLLHEVVCCKTGRCQGNVNSFGCINSLFLVGYPSCKHTCLIPDLTHIVDFSSLVFSNMQFSQYRLYPFPILILPFIQLACKLVYSMVKPSD